MLSLVGGAIKVPDRSVAGCLGCATGSPECRTKSGTRGGVTITGQVNHSDNYVNPVTMASTQAIESHWEKPKRKIPRHCRGVGTCLKWYLAEAWWRTTQIHYKRGGYREDLVDNNDEDDGEEEVAVMGMDEDDDDGDVDSVTASDSNTDV